MNFQVSKLTPADAGLLKELRTCFFTKKEKPSDEHLAKALKDERVYLYAAITERQIAGYCLVYKFNSIYSDHYL